MITEKAPDPRHPGRCRWQRPGLAAAVLATAMAAVQAQPVAPGADDVVVMQLPAQNRDPLLRSAARAAALTTEQRIALARRHLWQAGQRGDPRDLGRAGQLLGGAELRSDVRAGLLRAGLLQARHEFEPALALLDTLLKRDPQLAEAWFMRAGILRVRGELSSALAACTRAHQLQPRAESALCAADLAQLGGQPALHAQWMDTWRASGRAAATSRPWTELVLAEMAARQGRDSDAARHYRRSLADAGVVALDSHARWLTLTGQADRVSVMIQAFFPDLDQTPDALLLRRVLAARATGSIGPEQAADAELAARFAEADRLGIETHHRERAEWLLLVRDEPEPAFRHAMLNWHEGQRETPDLLILVRSARAAGREAPLRMVRDFIDRNAYSDPQVTRLFEEELG
ncbi:MAG: hypothetical protein R3E68_00875 [Burkholderiaceae bacterium]